MSFDPAAPERLGAPDPVPPDTTGFAHSALPLVRSGSRVAWLVVGGLIGLFALFTGIGVLSDGKGNAVVRAIVAVCAFGIFVRILWGTRQGFRAAMGDTPWLELHPTLGLRLHDPILMREPIAIPREALRAAIVEEETTRRRRTLGSTLAKFPVSGTETWTWSAWSGSRLPQLGHARDVPNVAIVLAEPVAAPKLRRGGRTWMFGHPPHGRVRTGEPIPGLLCTARDPDLARQAFASWGLGAPLCGEDLDPIDARAPSRRRQARFARFAVVAFVAWTGLTALASFGVFG